jgi:hypothetical protein
LKELEKIKEEKKDLEVKLGEGEKFVKRVKEERRDANSKNGEK